MPDAAVDRLTPASLLEALDVPVALLGPDGTLAAANAAFADLVRMPLVAVVGQHVDELGGPGKVPLYVDLLRSREPVERSWTGGEDQPLALVWSGKLLPGGAGLIACSVRIAQHAGDAAELAQSQKMESLGTMAGGLAHDFNNLLTAILGFAGILKLSANLDEESREHLSHIEQAAKRGADIAGRLLAFARGGLARFVTLDLRDVISETVSLASPALHTSIAIDVALPDEPVIVEGDFGQMQQSLLNIILNARDAMPGGGSIRVRLEQDTFQAVVSIVDDGPGMTEEVRSRAFEPFFTTKERGAGTGLGLAIAYGIVRGHKGTISLDSSPGNGSVFTISLPRSVPAESTHVLDAGDGDLVMVVDDDDLTRKSLSATLGRLGYNVVEVANGPMAVTLVSARPGRFSAVLLDLVMPGMNGREVFHALSSLRSDLPIVVCTGYAADAQIDDVMRRNIAGLLQKPFTPEALHSTLSSAGARPARARR